MEIKSGKPPEAMFGHTAVLYKKKIIFFGGYNNNGWVLNNLFVLDLCNQTWNEIKTIGEKPKGRFHHNAFIRDEKMYIFGGKAAGDLVLNDVWFLDCEKMIWSPIQLETQIVPAPRYGHYAFIRGSELYVFGGCNSRQNFKKYVYRFLVNEREWERLEFQDAVIVDLPDDPYYPISGSVFGTVLLHGMCLYFFG